MHCLNCSNPVTTLGYCDECAKVISDQMVKCMNGEIRMIDTKALAEEIQSLQVTVGDRPGTVEDYKASIIRILNTY